MKEALRHVPEGAEGDFHHAVGGPEPVHLFDRRDGQYKPAALVLQSHDRGAAGTGGGGTGGGGISGGISGGEISAICGVKD